MAQWSGIVLAEDSVLCFTSVRGSPLSYNKSNLEMLTLADMYIYRPFLHRGSFANRM